MDYPKKLLEEIQENSRGFQLEGFLSGRGPKDATAMLVGEAPGRTEIETHIPFSGQAGKELDAELAAANLKRDDLYITSVVRSRPYRIKKRIQKKTGETIESRPNRTPTQAEIKAHAPLIDYEIEQVQPPIIATMGNVSLKRLVGKGYTISNCHGQVIEQPILQISNDRSTYVKTDKHFKILPLYHPAAILYNRSLKEIIAADWATLFNLIHDYKGD